MAFLVTKALSPDVTKIRTPSFRVPRGGASAVGQYFRHGLRIPLCCIAASEETLQTPTLPTHFEVVISHDIGERGPLLGVWRAHHSLRRTGAWRSA